MRLTQPSVNTGSLGSLVQLALRGRNELVVLQDSGPNDYSARSANSYHMSARRAATGGNVNEFWLNNANGNTMDAWIDRIMFGVGAAVTVKMSSMAANAGTSNRASENKRLASAGGTCTFRENVAAAGSIPSNQDIDCVANLIYVYDFDAPVILPPNNAFGIGLGTVNIAAWCRIEWREFATGV